MSNKILSKDKFYSQKRKAISSNIHNNLNSYYANKKNSRKLGWARVVLWIGLVIWIIGFLIVLAFATIGILQLANIEGLEAIKQNSSLFYFSGFISGAILLLIGCPLFTIALNKKNSFKTEVVSKFNRYPILTKLFNYFNIEYFYEEQDGKVIKNNKNINFFRNLKNFRDLEEHHFIVNGKYEQYYADNANALFKFQNLQYDSSIWKVWDDLKGRQQRKLKKQNATRYNDLVQIKGSVKRFGIAVKLNHLNPNVNVTLFDNENNYTPKYYKKVDKANAYSSLHLMAEDPEVLDTWLDNKDNLQYIQNVSNELKNIQVNDPSRKKLRKKDKINNLSLIIKNQEAFIWFDTPYELIDLAYVSPTLNKNEIADNITDKLLDDFYLIYLALQLLVPFSLNINYKDYSETKKTMSRDMSDIEAKKEARKKGLTSEDNQYKELNTNYKDNELALQATQELSQGIDLEEKNGNKKDEIRESKLKSEDKVDENKKEVEENKNKDQKVSVSKSDKEQKRDKSKLKEEQKRNKKEAKQAQKEAKKAQKEAKKRAKEKEKETKKKLKEASKKAKQQTKK